MTRICTLLMFVGMVGCVATEADVEETSTTLETTPEVDDIDSIEITDTNQAYEYATDVALESGGCSIQFYCMTRTSTGICIRYGYCMGRDGACDLLCESSPFIH